MKHRIFLAWLGLALLCAAATARAHGPAAGDWAADEAEIRRQLEASVAAFNRGDLKAHLAIYDEDVTFMTQDGPRPGVAPLEAAFRGRYFDATGKPLRQLRFEQLAVRRLAPDVALATARWVLAGGDAREEAGWFTLVWVRYAWGWRAVHDHSS